mmetsp:Transcript_12165/g.19642  ORF Transcript_12165/g.19642 Transcript_12165/m.19642 type:complete len:414 (-) Transcript_12165:790-2031(-)
MLLSDLAFSIGSALHNLTKERSVRKSALLCPERKSPYIIQDFAKGTKLSKFLGLSNSQQHKFSFARSFRPSSPPSIKCVSVPILEKDTASPEPPLIAPPVIDVSSLFSPDADEAAIHQTIAEIGRACADWGFFQIVGHGVPRSFLQHFDAKIRAFFALPEEVKKEVERTATNARGWFNKELTKQTLDWKEVFDIYSKETEVDGFNQWPREEVAPGFKEAIEQYHEYMVHVGDKLLRAVALSLSLKQDFFAPFFKEHEHTSLLRVNYYPPLLKGEDLSLSKFCVNRHTDSGALTILAQDENGPISLQVRKGDQWYSIPPVPDAFVINVGDLMQVWTNDLFQAPEHRVLTNRTRERFSAPFFYNPSYDTDVEPVVVKEGDKPHYRALNYGEFMSKRIEGNYADLGEEVQVSHYRI